VTYPAGYFPGSEQERVELARQAFIRDAKAEEERLATLPAAAEASPAIPGLSDSERAELARLRAEALSDSDRAELDRLRASANRPYAGEGNA
jgi:hypothetical protein